MSRKDKDEKFDKFDKDEDTNTKTVEKKSSGKNIIQVNTMGRDHKIQSVLLEGGKKVVPFADVEKNIDGYCVDGKNLQTVNGRLFREGERTDLIHVPDLIHENWYPNQEPQTLTEEAQIRPIKAE